MFVWQVRLSNIRFISSPLISGGIYIYAMHQGKVEMLLLRLWFRWEWRWKVKKHKNNNKQHHHHARLKKRKIMLCVANLAENYYLEWKLKGRVNQYFFFIVYSPDYLFFFVFWVTLSLAIVVNIRLSHNWLWMIMIINITHLSN